MHLTKTPFLYLASLSAFSLLVFDLYQPALPAITAYFNTSHALGQLTLSLFFFVFGLSQLFWGPLVDHYGRRGVLRFSFYLFLLATIACMLAPSIEILILGRGLQGFAVCCANIVAFSCTRDEEDNTARARLLSHISMIVSVSPIFAPLLGSFIFVHFGWRADFLFMLMVAIILLLLVSPLVHESVYWSRKSHRLTFKTSLLSYRKLAGHPQLWITTAIITAAFSCVMIAVVNIAYLLIDNLGLSPFWFSILFASNGFILIGGNFLGIYLRRSQSLTTSIRQGSWIMVFGSLLCLILFYEQGLTLWSLMPLLFINAGVTLTNPPAFSLAIANYTHETSTAIALLNTVRNSISAVLGGVVGVLLVNEPLVFPYSFFFCSLLCLAASYFCKEAEAK